MTSGTLYAQEYSKDTFLIVAKMSNVTMNYRGVAVGATCLLIIVLVSVSIYHRPSPELQHISRSKEGVFVMPEAVSSVSISLSTRRCRNISALSGTPVKTIYVFIIMNACQHRVTSH